MSSTGTSSRTTTTGNPPLHRMRSMSSSYRASYAELSNNSSIIERELASSTDEILATCPKFRILVLGKSGAGKSSLINAAFDVDIAQVSHERAGLANIEKEITSDQNPRFTLHDSQGFAAGETQNFEKVKNFIDERATKPELKDRLHAIWFCLEIPTENGALFQIADENFLQLELYNTPVMIVFTKFDLLVRKLEREATDDVNEKEVEAIARQRAEDFFKENCVKPLRRITSAHSYVKVSSKQQYRDSLVQLVDETQSHLDDNMWILWALAQRNSVDGKIAASIEIGRRKYWRGIASSLHFPGKTIQQCLNRIHDDMIDVWNFNDPDKHLKSPNFKAILAYMLKDLDDTGPNHARGAIATAAGTIGAITSMIPGAVVIAVPTAAGVAIAQWLYFAYQETPAILQLLMGYICDLTNVLQCLFWILQARGIAVQVEPYLIETALDAHDETGAVSAIHQRIRNFVEGTPTFQLFQRDRALNELIKIIQNVRFRPENTESGSQSSLAMTIAEDMSSH